MVTFYFVNKIASSQLQKSNNASHFPTYFLCARRRIIVLDCERLYWYILLADLFQLTVHKRFE